MIIGIADLPFQKDSACLTSALKRRIGRPYIIPRWIFTTAASQLRSGILTAQIFRMSATEHFQKKKKSW